VFDVAVLIHATTTFGKWQRPERTNNGEAPTSFLLFTFRFQQEKPVIADRPLNTKPVIFI
jgi:hypothetical protein